jgi:phage FluMu gp28-like protein
LILLEYAKRFFAAKNNVKVWPKSRRIGASWSCAAVAALRAGAKRQTADIRPMDVWYVGYNKDMAEEFVRDTGSWVGHYQIAADAFEEEIVKDGDKDILTYVIRFASGFRVTALSSRPSNLRGKQGLVIIDEAAFHEDLPGLLKAALALLMWGGELWVLSSHNGVDNAFNELVEDCRAGRKPYYCQQTTLDDALGDGLYQRICLSLGLEWSMEAQNAWRAELIEQYGDDADEELFCVPSNGGGAYFQLSSLERSMVLDAPIFKFECTNDFAAKPEPDRVSETQRWLDIDVAPQVRELVNPHWLSFFGMDFARSGDLSVFLPLQERADLRKVCPFALELRNVPFEQQKQIVLFVVSKLLPKFMYGALDATGNGSYLSEVCWQKYGEHRISRCNLNRPFYSEYYPKYRADLQEGGILLPRSADWKADHRLVVLDKGVGSLPDKTIKGADGKQRHGDSASAGLLACYATRQEYFPDPDWHPAADPASELPEDYWGGESTW